MYSAEEIATRIRDAEAAVGSTTGEPTYTSLRNRFPKFRDSGAREDLRKEIIAELIQVDRLDSDDQIELGVGGAKPKGREPDASKTAYFIIGLPASGKSTLVNEVADKLGAMILDSDFAKRKLPEFGKTAAGANIVHKESHSIIFGTNDDEPSLLKYCLQKGLNVVIPTIGQNAKDLSKRRDALISTGYSVHLTLTLLSREVATERALSRFLTTGRYIPLGLIFDGYANDPIMNNYKARVDTETKKDSGWASFGAVSSAAGPARVEDCTSEKNPAMLLVRKI